MRSIRVWDLPTRLFHWLLVGSVIGMFITANVDDALSWHFRIGYFIASLLLFRVVWGLVGGYWSRFTHFRWSVPGFFRTLRGGLREPSHVGHGHAGTWSVVALLTVLGAQVTTGLFSDDDISMAGPLASLVDGEWVSRLTSIHKEVTKVGVLVLVLLHVGAIAFYAWRRKQNLVRAMVTGDQSLDEMPINTPASRDGWTQRALALVIWAACAAAVAGMVSRFG